MRKLYDATFLLGHHSDTDDTEGQVTMLENAPEPTRAAIERALPGFEGTIEQRPPVYSALKVAGRRAYKLARQGTNVQLAPRSVTIHHLRILRYAYPELQLEIECSSGTYVRALGRDLAEALGTRAVMSALVRVAIGNFRLENSVPLNQLTRESLPKHLQSPLAAVSDLPQVIVDCSEIVEIRHGRPIDSSRWISPTALELSSTEWAAVDADGELVAILRQVHPNQFWPTMNFQPIANNP
jgi:tRNA pseudouridine55 synthase